MQQLRAIVALASGQGFSRTAAELGLSTPTVWQQIRGLEAEFGVPLVEVRGQSVSLTPQGRQLVELATPVVLGFDSLRDLFKDHVKSLPQRLTIAAPNSVLSHELPEPLSRYRAAHPKVELTLIDMPSNPARQLVEAGKADLATVGQLQSTFPSTLAADHVTDYPFVLVCPADHPILAYRRLMPRHLLKYDLIMQSPGTNSRTRVDEVLGRTAGALPRIAFTASTKEILLRYVRSGFGISVVSVSPRYLASRKDGAESRQGLVFRDLSHVFGHEHVYILRRRHQHELPHQLAFRQTVLHCAGRA